MKKSIGQDSLCSKQDEQERVNSHSCRIVVSCTLFWLSDCVAIALFSIIFAVFERGVHEEKSKEREPESLSFLSCVFRYLMESLWVGKLGGHGSQYPTLCVPWTFPLFFCCPCWEKGWGNRSLERVCKANTERLPTLTRASCHITSVPRVLNDHSGTSNLPQARWVNSVSVLLTWWRGETEVGIEWAEAKGQAQMSAKISLDSLGSQPSNYRRFKQTINEHSTCKNELPFVSLLPSVY